MKNSKNNKTRSFEERNKLANAELRIATFMCLENNYGFGSVTAEQLYDLSGLTAGDWDAFTGMGMDEDEFGRHEFKFRNKVLVVSRCYGGKNYHLFAWNCQA